MTRLLRACSDEQMYAKIKNKMYDIFRDRNYPSHLIRDSDRWLMPACMYLSLSSTTMPDPLSAVFMTNDWSEASSLRVFLSI